jgi:hypothetical protein
MVKGKSLKFHCLGTQRRGLSGRLDSILFTAAMIEGSSLELVTQNQERDSWGQKETFLMCRRIAHSAMSG